jgi:hypothetical protein
MLLTVLVSASSINFRIALLGTVLAHAKSTNIGHMKLHRTVIGPATETRYTGRTRLRNWQVNAYSTDEIAKIIARSLNNYSCVVVSITIKTA